MPDNPNPLVNDLWSRTETSSFGQPPLEAWRLHLPVPWRGARLGDVINALYYEADGYNPHVHPAPHPNCNPDNQIPLPFFPQVAHLPLCITSDLVEWDNIGTAIQSYDNFIRGNMSHIAQYVKLGLSNAISISNLSYDQFSLDNLEESPELHDGTLVLAISYSHFPSVVGVLKAVDFQIAQLETIFEALRAAPPPSITHVRLWTDQVLSRRLRASPNRPKWILYGLLPYAVFPVVNLFSHNHNHLSSMWSACEQLLADGGCGAFFINLPNASPFLCKTGYVGPDEFVVHNALKTAGDGLSPASNLARLSTYILAGLLDETLAYHLEDAQILVKLAYFLSGPAYRHGDVLHVVSCPRCLHDTQRLNTGYLAALRTSMDVYAETEDSINVYYRVNRTMRILNYPTVRARRGFVAWHGMREFLPTAGMLARQALTTLDWPHSRRVVIALSMDDELEITQCRAVVILVVQDGQGRVGYIALWITGRRLLSEGTIVESSTRLNVIELSRMHAWFFKNEGVRGSANMMFSHPMFDEIDNAEMVQMLNLDDLHW